MAATALGNIPLSTTIYPSADVDAALSGLASGVSEEIASAVSTAWKAGGSKAPTDLTSALLVAANEGKVYNMSASGTTDTNFVEGSGVPYLAGTDIAVIDVGTGGTHTYKFNVLAATDSSVVKSIYLGNSAGTPLTPTNGAVTIPISDSTTKSVGLISYEDWMKLSGIASGAEVNQNAFSKIAVSGVTGTGDADAKTDTLTLVPGTNVTMSRSGKSVTIGATVPTGVVKSVNGITPNSSGEVTIPNADSTHNGLMTCGMYDTLTSLPVRFFDYVCGDNSTSQTESGGIGGLRFSGANGITVEAQYGAQGEPVITIAGAVDDVTIDQTSIVNSSGVAEIPFASTVSGSYTAGVVKIAQSISDMTIGAVPTAAEVSGAIVESLSAIKNFSKITVRNASGTAVTNGEITPETNADTNLGFKAGSNVTLSTSGKNIVISASQPTIPVTDGKISGGSSLLSGTTIVIPVASTSAKGVTQLTDSVSNSTTTAITPNAVSGAISGVNSGLATKVSGGSLHTALSGSGLANGVGSGNNTIYALINALHSVDGQSES